MPRPTSQAACSPSRRALLAAVAVIGFTRLGRIGVAAQDATPAADPLTLLPAAPELPAGAARAEGPLRVIATTGILADLARQVGGQRVIADSMLPANADPHDFEPTPAEVAAAGDAALLVAHGLGFDAFAEQLIAAYPDTPLVTASDNVPLRTGADDAGESDPHWWFDPTLAAIAADSIAAALAAVDPAGAADYAARAAAYGDGLLALDAGIRAAIETVPPDRRKIVTNHDNLGYFADRYGLEIVGTVIPGGGTTAEPSAAEIAALLETIAETGAPAVFAENTASPALAEALAAEAGIAVIDDLYTDNLGEPGTGADTYAGLMRTDVAIIVAALR